MALPFASTSRQPAEPPSKWRHRARCKDAPTDLFVPDKPEDEPACPPPEAMAYCGRCPVQQKCLEWALEQSDPEMIGVWGGTSRYQRRQMRRVRVRARCPKCGETPRDHGHEQICLACGASWAVA